MNSILGTQTQNDISILRHQLKRDNINIAGVVERCVHGYPSVVLLNPLADEKSKRINHMAISNLLWLSCPYLNEKIHEFESRGYINRISEYIRNDRFLESRMKDAHANYYYLRKKVYRHYLGGIFSIEDNKNILSTGIGGIRDIENIKCLHMHYAHYRICGDNFIGRLLFNLLDGKISCDERRCANACKRE